MNIQEFKNHLISDEKSDATVERYMRDVTAYISWLDGREMSKELMIQYKAELVDKYEPASVNTMLASLNASVLKFKRKLKALCKRKWSIDLTYRITKINQVIRGWINYFLIGSIKKALTKIDEHLRTMIRVIIWKQWKVPSKREWGLKKLGINKDLARLTSYCGNRYQWIVTKTCVVRAISKEKLTKRGLVRCIDYYNSRRHILKLN